MTEVGFWATQLLNLHCSLIMGSQREKSDSSLSPAELKEYNEECLLKLGLSVLRYLEVLDVEDGVELVRKVDVFDIIRDAIERDL